MNNSCLAVAVITIFNLIKVKTFLSKCNYSGDETYHIINERYHLRRSEDDIYTDVYSGKLYQHQVASGFLINRNIISFTLNTDGIPVF